MYKLTSNIKITGNWDIETDFEKLINTIRNTTSKIVTVKCSEPIKSKIKRY